MQTLFVTVHLLLNGRGDLVFGASLDDSLPTRLEAVQRQQEAASIGFALGKRKKSTGAISGK